MSLAPEESNLDEIVEAIETRQDLAAFLRVLHADLLHNPGEWENDTLARFLEALAAWTEDMEGAFANQSLPVPYTPSWSLVATMLLAARVYE